VENPPIAGKKISVALLSLSFFHLRPFINNRRFYHFFSNVCSFRILKKRMRIGSGLNFETFCVHNEIFIIQYKDMNNFIEYKFFEVFSIPLFPEK
jgi:hypothetical protein